MLVQLKIAVTLTAIISLLLSSRLQATGNRVDKVYHPYVTPQETEVELRSITQFDKNSFLNNQQTHRAGLGYSFIENLFTEAYLIGKNTPNDDFDLDAIELEAKIQLTEQGEYDEDWGLVFEYSKGFGTTIDEFSSGLLIDKEMGRWTGALNLFLEYEWGGGEKFKNELESSLASQLRYRYSRRFEPAVEFYQGQHTTAIGPAMMGDIRFAHAKKLHWETGLIFGLRARTPDQTLRLLLEYEF